MNCLHVSAVACVLLVLTGPLQARAPGGGDTTCIQIQSDALGVKDGFVASCIPCGYPDSNFGTTPDFVVAGWTNQGAGSDTRSLIQFGLQAIPMSAELVSATFSLYFNPTSFNGEHSTQGGSNEAWLQRITEPWLESQVTWNSQPATITADQVYIEATTTPDEDRPAIDVLPLLAAAMADLDNYHGWLFRLANEDPYRRMIFASSDHADPARHPKLEVCYTLSVGVAEILDPRVEVLIRPDPFTEQAVMDLSSFGDGPLDLRLIDAMGNEVRRWITQGERSFVLERRNLPGGTYTLSIRSANGRAAYARMVIE